MALKKALAMYGGKVKEIQAGDYLIGVSRPIFKHFTTVATATVSEEILYTSTIPANTLANNGDVLRFEYTGYTGTSNGDSNVLIYFNSSLITKADDYDVVNGVSKAWTANGTIMRESNSTIRFTIHIAFPNSGIIANVIEATTVSGLDLAANEYEMELRAASEFAGDILAYTGSGNLEPGT